MVFYEVLERSGETSSRHTLLTWIMLEQMTMGRPCGSGVMKLTMNRNMSGLNAARDP